MIDRFVVCAECPAEFQYIASVNGCYKVITHNSEWSVAALGCRALHKDAHLLVINNAQEHYAVAGMLASIDRQYRFVLPYFFHFWLRSKVNE